MDVKQLELLNQLQEIGFSTLELALYLNTHPTDERAVALHNTYASRYKELCEIYNMNFGPLTNMDLSKCPWEYINGPWPWEIEYINQCI